MTAVHQFHPVLAPADAMSNHVFALRKRIRGWGYDSYAYAVEAKAGVADVRAWHRRVRVQPPNARRGRLRRDDSRAHPHRLVALRDAARRRGARALARFP